VYRFPNAIDSAKNVVECGDYLSLFELRQPVYVYPVPEVDARTDGRSHDEMRDQFVTALEFYLNEIENDDGVSLAELCDHFMQSGASLGNTLFEMGLPGNVAYSSAEWLVDIRNSCASRGSTLESFSGTIRRVLRSFEDLLNAVERTSPESGRDVTTVAKLSTTAFGDDGKFIQFTTNVRQSLTNSSTNYNRKRAAYVLDRFFCDDLTPVNVESIEEHSDNRHGSDQSCYACHYRLDPMAGFFKDYGIALYSFAGADSIIFDDMVTMDKTEYQSAWLAPEDSGRRWNIGYIRSLDRHELNDYGSDLEGLFHIIKTSPEVKRCVVKRMHEYFTSEDQMIDAGYLDYLTKHFVESSSENAARAFKELAARLVLSRVFLERDPETESCYDFAPGHQSGQSPPCNVRYLLEKNCISCHGATRQEGGLDLSSWVATSDGEMSFLHVSRLGRHFEKETTFASITARLSHPDPRKRMPLDRHMDTLERQELFLWADEMSRRGSE
jgi:hypothetical protein